MFLVAISKAADEMVNIKPLDKLNVEEFKAQEQKRVDILEAQAQFLDKEAVIMQRLIRVEAMQKRNEILRGGIAQKASWWPWKKSSEMSVYEIVASAQDARIVDLEQQIADIKTDIPTAQPIPSASEELDSQMDLGTHDSLDNEDADNGLEDERDMDPINITQFYPRKSSSGQKASIKVSSRRKSMSVVEAANFLECSDRQVRRLRENGTLVTGEDDRLTSASVKAYKKKRSIKIGQEGA
jgi:hypothetical protein